MTSERNLRVGKPLGPVAPRAGRPALARKLIAERLRRELSQEQAATEIPVAPTVWAEWESGRKRPRLRLYRVVVDLWVAGRWPLDAAGKG